jgi:uncharacterized membrane protein
MNNNTIQSPKTVVRTLGIIHLALLAGQALFAFVMFTLSEQTSIKLDKNDIFIFIVPVFAVAAFFISQLLFKTLLNKAVNTTGLNAKLSNYQIAVIVRMALLESASLFAIVVYYLTGNFLYLLIAILLMIYGVVIRPTAENIADDLLLTYDEKMQL